MNGSKIPVGAAALEGLLGRVSRAISYLQETNVQGRAVTVGRQILDALKLPGRSKAQNVRTLA